MRAARDFATRLRERACSTRSARVTCTLYGSLGATGIGHGTPDAVVAGLQGLAPETVDPDAVRSAWTGLAGGRARSSWTARIRVPFAKARRRLRAAHAAARPSERDDARGVAGRRARRARDRIRSADDRYSARRALDGARHLDSVTAMSRRGAPLLRETYYSVGGGFIRRDGEPRGSRRTRSRSFADAEALCSSATSAASRSPRPRASTRRRCAPTRRSPRGSTRIWDAMAACVEAGLHADGVLPGMLR